MIELTKRRGNYEHDHGVGVTIGGFENGILMGGLGCHKSRWRMGL